MEHRRTESGYFLRFERGEEIVAGLTGFLERQGIAFASVQAIGALDRAELGFYDLDGARYLRRRIEKDREILSLLGNASLVDGRPFAHLHAVLGDAEMRVQGGHLFEGRVSATCEMRLDLHGGRVERHHDEATGLKLLRLEDQ